MDDLTGLGVFVLMFVARCVLPAALLMGTAYLLHRLGLVPDEAQVALRHSPSASAGE
mgnify:CR=1 FL=1